MRSKLWEGLLWTVPADMGLLAARSVAESVPKACHNSIVSCHAQREAYAQEARHIAFLAEYNSHIKGAGIATQHVANRRDFTPFGRDAAKRGATGL